MQRLATLLAWFRSALGGRGAERRMHEEFQFHLDMETEKNLGLGMLPDEARRAALLAFGGEERHREAMRDGRGLRWLHDALRDARLGLRMLRREPALSASIILTLALTMGATTAVLTLVRQALLDPLPYAEPNRLAQLATRYAGWGVDYGALSEPETDDLRGLTGTLQRVAVYRRSGLDLSVEDRAQRVRGLQASFDLLPVLGVSPAMGRAFDATEDNPGGPRVVLLSHGLWQRLGRDSTIVGMTVRLDGYRYTVIGVLPRRFDFADAEILVPLRLDPADPGSRGAHYLAAVGRLAPGVSFARATADLDALSSRLRADNPANYTEDMQWRLVARPLRDAIVGNAGEALGLLSAAVVLVMIVACANVANLLLARTQRREPELALRTALGAGRSRIARQLITEGLILAVAGALLGVGLAVAGTNALLALAPGAIPRAERLSVDAGLLLTALVIGCGSAVFFSLAPALRATGMAGRSPGQLWSDAGRVIDSGGRRGGLRGFMHLLIGVETGLAVVVMIVAGLLVQSYARLAGEDVGLSPEGVLAFDITLPTEGYAVPAGRIAFFRQLTSRLEQLPGVERAGGVLSLPLRSGTGNIDIELEGRPVAPGASAPSPLFQVVTPGYFETVRVPLVLGRLPAASDDEGAPLVAWVNQTAARRLWHDESPIGRRFRFRGDSGDTWFTVAGVVGDVRTLAVAREPIWEYYVAHAQLPRVLDAADFHRGLSIVARVTGDPAALAGPLWRILAELDAGVAAAQVEPMTAVVARSISRSRLVSVLLSGFAALAGVLAAIGVYGVLSYGVSRRTREIGVRIALGATPARVVRAVTRQAVGAAGLGLLAGSLAALAVTRVLHNQLYDTGPRDPLVFGAAVFALGTVSALSALLPARRAARVPPAVALRDA